MTSHVPRQAWFFLHLKEGDAVWAGLESTPGLRAIWQDPEFQRLTRLRADFDQALDKLARKPWARLVFQFDREGLRFLSGESAFVLLAPHSRIEPSVKAGRTKRVFPALLFLRLEGARGALARMAAALFSDRFSFDWWDLGGGLVALGFKGAKLAEGAGSEGPLSPWVEDGAMARIELRPESLRALDPRPEISSAAPMEQAPAWHRVFGFERAPREIGIELTPTVAGGLVARGRIAGPLPKPSKAAPLIDLGEAQTMTLFEARLPLDAEAAFKRYLMAQQEDDKGRRRWGPRLMRLKEANVDLDRDLWPHLGRALMLRLVPPLPGAAVEQGVVLASIPFYATAEARTALAELLRVRWKGLYDRKAPSGAERPYLLRQKAGSTELYTFVKGNFTRPMWLAAPEGLSFISDAFPLGLMPRVKENVGEGEETDASLAGVAKTASPPPVFSIRLDGVGISTHVSALIQMYLEDLRDEYGAAEFVEHFPDPDAVARLAGTASVVLGRLSVQGVVDPEVESHDQALIGVHWAPAPN